MAQWRHHVPVSDKALSDGVTNRLFFVGNVICVPVGCRQRKECVWKAFHNEAKLGEKVPSTHHFPFVTFS